MKKSRQQEALIPAAPINDQVAMFVFAAPVAVALFDREMRYVAWSQLWAERYGTGDCDLLGLNHYDLFPNLPGHIIDAHRRALNGEEMRNDADRLELEEGHPTWERWRVKPIRDQQDDVAGIAIFTEDITDQKRAEESLKANETRLGLLVETLGIGILEWEVQKDTTSTNRYFREMLGVGESDMPTDLGGWVRLLQPVDRHALRHALRLALSPDGKGVFRSDIEPVVSDNKRKMQLVGRVLFENADGGRVPSGLFAVLLDETERADLQSSLARAHKLESIGRIAGTIAHDFNNLLSVILANVELANLRVSDRQTAELLDNAIQVAKLGGDFNKRLLTLSGKNETVPELVWVDEHILRIWIMFERLLNEHVTSKFIPGARDRCIRIDPAELDGAILNLVVNSRDAQPNGGTITIATAVVTIDAQSSAMPEDAKPGHYLEVSVSDDGHGMTETEILHATEPFFTSKPPEIGTGLGLTSVANAVARADGFMTIQSELGKGTKVSLFLPIADCDRKSLVEDEQSPRGNGERILVVEDDAMVREATLNRLEALGYDVLEAANGPTALELLASGVPVDLVLSDVIMTGRMTGFDLEIEVNSQYPQIAFLLASGHTSKAQQHRKSGSHRAELLRKPYSLAALAKAVDRALRHQKKR